MIRAALLAAMLALAFVALAAEPPLVGVAPNVPTGGGVKELIDGLRGLRALGCGLATSSQKWSDLEKTPGAIDLKPLSDSVNGLRGFGFAIALTFQTIDTNNRTLPTDLSARPFDDPETLRRWRALLTAAGPHLNRSVRWVMLGNEVDAYLAAHPGEVDAYCRMVRAGRDVLRATAPHVQVGVTTTWSGVRDNRALFDRLNEVTDVVTMTYYPLRPDFGVRPVSGVAADFRGMVGLAGRKPLLVQEVGLPADLLLGSSDATQAAFVDAVFDALTSAGDRVVGACFFLLYDFSREFVDDLVKYYGLPDPRFRAFLSSLGLKRTDGTERPAYARFVARMRTRGRAPRAKT